MIVNRGTRTEKHWFRVNSYYKHAESSLMPPFVVSYKVTYGDTQTTNKPLGWFILATSSRAMKNQLPPSFSITLATEPNQIEASCLEIRLKGPVLHPGCINIVASDWLRHVMS